MNNLLPAMPGKATFVYTIYLLSLIPITKGADPFFLTLDCPDATLNTTSTYAPNSTYQTNLNTLFSVLSSNSNNASNGFYNFTAGSSPPDIAYGLFLCRGDLTATTCHDCVVYASKAVVAQCPTSKRVSIWYIECMLRTLCPSHYSFWFDDHTQATTHSDVLASVTGAGEMFGTAVLSIKTAGMISPSN
ncbi:hypothetical protein RHGRI_037320 [Rhododendron griersonianum]|uniref:Gnk2-homologous domain-containing protein n=1 Tax=Rhododendron griersonianum TaxID=479676 RepID=A0AAV6HRC8_9ERIC|nr:hypothetical protein RHGRI_037320 [Rhododendron griersonianum]